MNKFYTIAIVLIFLSGCTTATDENDVKPTIIKQTSADPANQNGQITANSQPEMIPYDANIDQNAFDADSNANIKTVIVEPKLSDKNSAVRAAPYDSTFSSGSRGREFYELRQFNNHPVLLKVERILDPPNPDKYNIFLKNGKIITAPAEKMTNIALMTPESFLEAIGMQGKTEKQSVTKSSENKVKAEKKNN